MLNCVRIISYRPQRMKLLLNVYSCKCLQRNIHNVGLEDIPKITVGDIRKILRQKGFAVQDGFTSLTTKCSLCSGDEKPAESKIYVNKITGEYYAKIHTTYNFSSAGTIRQFFLFSGYFVCPKCNVHGDWNILERLLKKVRVEPSLKDFRENCHQDFRKFQTDWQSIVDHTTSLMKLNESEVYDLFKLFEFPVSKFE